MKSFSEFLLEKTNEDAFDRIKYTFDKKKKRNFLFGKFDLELIKLDKNSIEYNVIHYGENTNIASIISGIRRNLSHEHNDSYKKELNKTTTTEKDEIGIKPNTKVETKTKGTTPGPYGERFETNIKIERIK